MHIAQLPRRDDAARDRGDRARAGGRARHLVAHVLPRRRDGLARLKQRIQEFRRELIELAEREPAHSQVVQLNLQLFPLSEAIAPRRRAARGSGKSVEVREDDDAL